MEIKKYLPIKMQKYFMLVIVEYIMLIGKFKDEFFE
jgi:hypothetical protein